MKKQTRQFLKITSTLLFLVGGSFVLAQEDPLQNPSYEKPLKEALILRFEDPDSSIKVLQQSYATFVEAKDTVKSIRALMSLAYVYGHRANYKESYDRLWTALLLADTAKMELVKSSIYKAIGRYYSFYKRRKNAEKFLGMALDIKKKLIAKGELDRAKLVENYHALTSTYRELGEHELCKTYLDSSFMYYSPTASMVKRPFLRFEQAALYNNTGKYGEALDIFKEIVPWFTQNNPSYKVLVYNYMGDCYKGLGNFYESEWCYRKSLDVSAAYNSHIDFTPLVYERLSSLYFDQGKYVEAYNSLKSVKELDAIFFDSRSENNRPLLEIQDEFRKTKEEQAVFIREQRLAQLEQEEKVMLLEKIILVGLLAFLILFGVLYFKYVRSKHRAEKLLIRKKRELEIKKSNEIVELKNKELAASALKLIEKDVFIDKLKDKLCKGNGAINQHEIRQIVGSMSNRSASNWKEFEARFVSVNKSFYENLSRQFPKLTQGDLKLCALVKLNFSSKEMAKLLGISIESVHTTRYRLRKKLKLSRDINLTEFIANIGEKRHMVT